MDLGLYQRMKAAAASLGTLRNGDDGTVRLLDTHVGDPIAHWMEQRRRKAADEHVGSWWVALFVAAVTITMSAVSIVKVGGQSAGHASAIIFATAVGSFIASIIVAMVAHSIATARLLAGSPGTARIDAMLRRRSPLDALGIALVRACHALDCLAERYRILEEHRAANCLTVADDAYEKCLWTLRQTTETIERAAKVYWALAREACILKGKPIADVRDAMQTLGCANAGALLESLYDPKVIDNAIRTLDALREGNVGAIEHSMTSAQRAAEDTP